MSYQLVVTPDALNDFVEISAYIAIDSPKRARTFIEELRARMENSLRSFPNAGRRFGDLRLYTTGNYLVAYRVDDAAKTVIIILVTEGHRDWQELLEDRL
jgi:toxin ParE1/3/4